MPAFQARPTPPPHRSAPPLPRLGAVQLLGETLDEWVTCQRQWAYLEPIFGAEDVASQLPAEAARFVDVHTFYKDLMRKTAQAAPPLRSMARRSCGTGSVGGRGGGVRAAAILQIQTYRSAGLGFPQLRC